MVDQEETATASHDGDNSTPHIRNLPENSGATPIPQEVTRPKKLLRHEISDEELDMLNSSRRDGLLEYLMGVLGVATGSILPTINAIHGSYWVKEDIRTSLEFADLVQITMCFGSLFVAVFIVILRRKRGKSNDDLMKEIRERNRVS